MRKIDTKNKILQIAAGLSIIILFTMSACSPEIQAESIPTNTHTILIPILPESTQQVTPTQSPTSNTSLQSLLELGLTYQQMNGNRYAPGKGNLPAQTPIDIDLSDIPTWVVATPYQDGVIWYVTLQNGAVHAYYSSTRGVSEVSSVPSKLPPEMPPILKTTDNNSSLIFVPNPAQSKITHPILLPQSKIKVAIVSNGDLEFIGDSDETLLTLPVNALLDARLLVDERDRILLLTNPTDRYNHGVLGDHFEAASITLIETFPEPRVAGIISLPENEVVEGIAPIWVDLTGDGKREIIATISDRSLGAGIVVFSESGERLAEGPKMGQPNRWRHQIAVGDFLVQGEPELAVVRTPHIGGVVEFYRYSEGDFEPVAQLPGVTSHVIGSRNLDMSVAGDFDGNGTTELLVLNPSLTELVAVRRVPESAEIIWNIPLDGKLNTNLATATLSDGNIVLGVGRTDGVLRLWYP